MNVSLVVVIVDDEPLVLVVMAEMLKDLGCDVTAGSGGEASTVLSDNRRIEVLIADLDMPEMDGYQLGDQASRLRPDLRILPSRAERATGVAFRSFASRFSKKISRGQ